MDHGQWGKEVEVVELLCFFLQLNSSGLNFQVK